MSRISELILYRDREGGLLSRLSDLQSRCADLGHSGDEKQRQQAADLCMEIMQELVETAMSHGFSGNLWHSYLTYLLVYHENAYSRACEIRGTIAGGINPVAEHDFQIFIELFAYDFRDIEEALGLQLYRMASDFPVGGDDRRLFNRRIRDRIENLSVKLAQAGTVEAFKAAVDAFYKDFGCGKFGLHKAFRVLHREGEAQPVIVPITNIAHVRLDDLIGYESQKQKLRENTEAFLAGRRANNCLLFGDAGTGKSSSIKGILNEYYDRGLRVIEIYKHQLRDLVDVIAQIKNRNYRFIIYMDDLSFEEFETEYKYLKAVIEGGLEKKPDNVLIYATSNRRHLIRENYADKEGDIRSDMHTSDTVQEKLSLAYRFGVTIYFPAPVKKEFQEILKGIADRSGVNLPEEELFLEANKWELSHGGRSGRTAQQFIDYLLGKAPE